MGGWLVTIPLCTLVALLTPSHILMPLVPRQDAKVLFLVIAAFVAIAALVVHFKVLNIYNTLVRSYTAKSVCIQVCVSLRMDS